MRNIDHAIKLGVLGLGRAFTLMLPTFLRDPRVKVVAGYDPREEARQKLSEEFGAKAHTSSESLCRDDSVEWVYVATPHQMHAEHVILAAKNGKHVLVEKPLAISTTDARKMVNACKKAGVYLIVGHSHSFNTPVLLAKKVIESGAYGEARMIHAWNYTDFIYRPRRPEELNTALGGGVVFSQAAHQVDIVRMLAGGEADMVFARTGNWDPKRDTEGAYTAVLVFKSGVFASLTYNGYGKYDSDSMMGWRGELGSQKSHKNIGEILRRHKMVSDELAEARKKADRNFGGVDYVGDDGTQPTSFQHFGPLLISCDKADIVLTPFGVDIYDENGFQQVNPEIPYAPRKEVIDEIWAVDRLGVIPAHDGSWSLATLEVCTGILKSSDTGRIVKLKYQVPVRS